MKINPLVSIIIPTYNRAKLIKETLNSIVAQTYSNWECIIVDDGSTDNMLAILEAYTQKDKRFHYYTRPSTRKKGANACRNYGLDIAKGDYIIFFDSDDVFSETALEERINSFKKNDVDMIITSMGLFTEISDLKVDENRFIFKANLEHNIDEFIVGDKLPWSIHRVTFKSSLIKNKIYFNEEMLRFQDVDFNIRVLKNLVPKYLSIDRTDCYYRNDTKSNERYNNKIFIDTVFENFYILYANIFKSLDKKKKEKLQKEIVIKLFVFIKAYYKKQNNSKIIIKIIKLFKEEFEISVSQQVALYSIYILNRFYYNKKGYFTITKKIRNMISE
ncbi:glycosyltransferase family 2 protein [Polaribacter sp. 20A6]|uniref:glycosyltransferase family 2 protein n=1 Tax=Polaribacter sp. 20A6 TaxID=2687289 RepID=UPI0013FDA1A1|nr:glycosyltransferase family 2 protein [Polaribacter sp. 20A6]